MTLPSAAAPPPSQRMASVDCAWLRMDEPGNMMVINGFMFFARPLDRRRLEEMLASRLGQVRRFRQRAVRRSSTRWDWEDVADWNVSGHVVEEQLAAPGGDAELAAHCSREMAVPLPAGLPPWRVHLVHGYHGGPSGEGREPGSALLWRLHHCMGDGIALMVLMLAICDLDAEADQRSGSGPWGSGNPLADLFGTKPLPPGEALQHLEEVLPEGARLLVRPAEELAKVNPWVRRAAWIPGFLKLSLRWPDPRTVFKGKLSGEKRVAWSRPVPLDQVRLAKQAVGGTVNDVLLTAIVGALRRYLEGRGQRTEGLSLRAIVPVSLRLLDDMSGLGNQFGMVFLPLPIGEREPRVRLAGLQRAMRALRTSIEPKVVLDTLRFLGCIPKLLQDLVIRIFGTKGTAVLTSVPGPNRPLYVAGQPANGIVFWVPQSGRIGMGISIMSYNGQVRLGVTTDAGQVPDPEAIVAAFEEELHFLEELKGAAAPQPQAMASAVG